MGWIKKPRDTGRLDVRGDLVDAESITAGGRAWIQRAGDRVHLSLYDIRFSSSGTVRVLTELPLGFRPIDREGYILSVSSSRSCEAIVMPTGLYLYAAPENGGRVRATISWSTADPFPTTYPGVKL